MRCGKRQRNRGIIPAGAGHFSVTVLASNNGGDHPRRCGALNFPKKKGSIKMGSSPQVRGTSAIVPGTEAIAGIIPAGAGHLAPEPAAPLSNRDHPRRCGALPAPFPISEEYTGSSPQVRGTFNPPRPGFHLCRIIPAGAGHFVTICLLDGFTGDHPRRCGALPIPRFQDRYFRGSSPQVRGTF